MQVNVEAGISQGLEIGITDYEYDFRRAGNRHLYVEIKGKTKNANAVKTCIEYLVDHVLTDSLLIEPPTEIMIASATKMTKNATTEVVEYKSLAEYHQLESDAEL